MSQEELLKPQPVRQGRVSRLFGQYVVKVRFQLKLSAVLFSIMTAAVFLMWLEGHLALNRMISAGLVQDEGTMQQLILMKGIIEKTGIILLAISFGITLFLSHFIAGPIYRLEKSFEELRNGNLFVYVRLRKNDEFKETADLLNQAVASLRSKLQKEREISSALMDKVSKLSEGLKAEGKGADSAALEQLMGELKNSFNQIRLFSPK